ncbi:hypothetical protein NE237_013602 [Protea cynaroides]|uniref:Uncharacterized protein n=1 Tax=Protea cynaroides TaxID=273540 RepID=A0A9Q0H087_9MAGN|nr:hypothetical protein NE237_013602 [Protea cynaroides]
MLDLMNKFSPIILHSSLVPIPNLRQPQLSTMGYCTNSGFFLQQPNHYLHWFRHSRLGVPENKGEGQVADKRRKHQTKWRIMTKKVRQHLILLSNVFSTLPVFSWSFLLRLTIVDVGCLNG